MKRRQSWTLLLCLRCHPRLTARDHPDEKTDPNRAACDRFLQRKVRRPSNAARVASPENAAGAFRSAALHRRQARVVADLQNHSTSPSTRPRCTLPALAAPAATIGLEL